MSKSYDNTETGPFYKRLWQYIMTFLPETEWYKLKRLNKTFYRLVKDSCKKGTIGYLARNNFVESIINLETKYCKNYGLSVACRHGHLEIAKLMIYKGADYFVHSMHQACRSGCLELTIFMIEKVLNNDKLDSDVLQKGLQRACKSGNLEIVNLMIENGANTDCAILRRACYSGNIEIINLMIEKDADDWNGRLLASSFFIKLYNIYYQVL